MSQELIDKVAEEVRAVLAGDSRRIGEVFRHLQEGKNETEIAALYGNVFTGGIYSYRRHINCLITGSTPTSTSVKRQVISVYRSFISYHESSLSLDVVSELRRRLALLEKPSDVLPEEEEEFLTLKRREELVLRSSVSGVYVYTLPHYYHQPIQPSEDDVLADRTLMKVGKSDSDVIRRFREQQRNTALPEEPLLLRIYTSTEDKGDVEHRLHQLLSAADHRRNSGRAAGTEWFLTSLKFLDALAADMALTQYFALTEEE